MTGAPDTGDRQYSVLADKPTSPQNRESGREFLARLRDPLRWKSAVYDVAVWFLFGWMITQALSMYAPGYPMLVGTPSIPTGLYWVDRHPAGIRRGDTVSFPFEPTQPWLKDRYGNDLVHTKIVLGVVGDTLSSATDGRLTLCHTQDNVRRLPVTCEPAGQAQTKDSAGRPLKSWVPPGHAYTLKDAELWVYAPHPRSLDSRYHGPIQASSVYGRATPLFLFGIPN